MRPSAAAARFSASLRSSVHGDSQLGSAVRFRDYQTRKKQKLENQAHSKIVFIGLGSRHVLYQPISAFNNFAAVY